MNTAKPRLYYGWIIVGTGLLIWILSIGHYYTFGIFFKPVSGDFGWNRTATSLASSITFFLSGILGVITGALTDRYGPRVVVATGGLLMGIGYLLLARIGTFPGVAPLVQFYLFYLIVGLGMSTGSAPLTATVARWFEQKRGRALGIMTVGGGLGQFLMPLVASQIISGPGWRWAYFAMGISMFAVIVASAQLLRRDPATGGLRPFGRSPAPSLQAHRDPSQPSAFTVRKALATKAFWTIFSVALLSLTTQVMVMMHIVNYATDPGKGINPATAATFIAMIGIANVVGKLVMGPVSDRIGRRATLAIVYILAGTMMLWLVVANEVWMFYIFAALFGFAYGGWIPMVPAMVADLFGVASLGMLIGAVQIGNAIGGAIGPIIGGFIYDTTRSYVIAFVLGAVLFYAAAGLVLSVKTPCKAP